jgi:hypothetical protein
MILEFDIAELKLDVGIYVGFHFLRFGITLERDFE